MNGLAMAVSEIITNAMDKVRGLLRREPKAMDAFGGDDLFDGEGEEEGAKNLGPKIALAVSGVMLLALVSLVVTVVMTGDEEAPTGGSLADIQIEEEPDPTAATDRSVERRPWLTPTDGGSVAPRRLGVEDPKPADGKTATATPAKPVPPAAAPTPPPTQIAKAPEAAKPEPTKPEPAKAEPAKTETAAATPAPTTPAPAPATPAAQVPPQQAAPTSQITATPAPAKAEPAKAEPAKPEPAKPAETKVAAATPPPKAEPAKTAPVKEEEPEEEQQAALPSLLAPAETAPGAPRRFDTADVGAATAGGKPRLNDPKLPPTDRASINAPPPRFNAVAEIKPPAAAPDSKVKLAIVVEGLGLNRTATEAALAKLPPVVTLAFSPYARDLKRLMERAKAKGHEVLIEVPMESKNFPAEDPGPLGLMTGLEAKDNQERLDTILK
ncbi:MAG: divergent polysaccharide deacetylase family protein, partial [Rhodospirillaceae bacterium]|nr:divergent polysaccharide deacetylase family protein [Rhodospirillaceae bacterium]